MKGKYNENVHAALLAAVGGYILYLAWMLLEKYREGAGEMPPALNIIAVVVLGAGGLGTLYYAWTVCCQEKKTDGENEGETIRAKTDKRAPKYVNVCCESPLFSLLFSFGIVSVFSCKSIYKRWLKV